MKRRGGGRDWQRMEEIDEEKGEEGGGGCTHLFCSLSSALYIT